MDLYNYTSMQNVDPAAMDMDIEILVLFPFSHKQA